MRVILISSFCDLIFNNLGPGNVSLLWSINFLFHVVIAGLAAESMMAASPIMSPTVPHMCLGLCYVRQLGCLYTECRYWGTSWRDYSFTTTPLLSLMLVLCL